MQLFVDFWSTSLTVAATASAVQISVPPAEAAKLAGLGVIGDFYALVLAERDPLTGAELRREIVHCTGTAGGLLDVTRGQEGTTAEVWDAGALIECRLTAATMETLRDSGGAELSDATPQPLGVAAPGSSPAAARGDHVHAAPTPGDIGAATAAQGAKADTAVQPAALTSGLATKVDKVTGYGLSQENFTPAEKTKLAGLESSHFKGLFASQAALEAAHPTAVPGDYADVDTGAGSDVQRYIWDDSDDAWVLQAGSGGSMTPAEIKTAYESNPDTNSFTDADEAKLDGIAAGATANPNTDSLAEGSTNKYFTESRVRAAVLTGLSLLTGGVIAAADTVLVALGKLQKQITDLGSSKQDTLVSGTNIKTVNGASVLGSGDLAVSSAIATRTVSSSGGVLNLSSFTETVFLVTLTENITSIQLPAGAAGQSKEARIVFTQAAGNYTIPTTTAAWGSIVVEGGGAISQMGTGAGTVGVYVLANDNNGTWRMYVDQAGDMLSVLASAEVSISAATTLTASAFGKMHVCSGTSSDYTVGLPAVSGNSGKLIGIRGDSALTRYVTLDPNASETIDGASSKVLRADEAMLLYCTGAAWTVLSLKSCPIKFSVTKTTDQSIAPSGFTKVTFNNTEYNHGGGFDLANSRFVCPRAGIYHLAANVTMNLTGSGDLHNFRVYKNGAQVRYPSYATTANTPNYVSASGATTLQLAVGDVVELYEYLAAAANRDITGGTLGATVFSMTEVLQ